MRVFFYFDEEKAERTGGQEIEIYTFQGREYVINDVSLNARPGASFWMDTIDHDYKQVMGSARYIA